MAVYTVLYNPKSDNKRGTENAKQLDTVMKGDSLTYVDVTTVDFGDLFAKMGADEKIILAGGDGTLNHYVNDTAGMENRPETLYFATGSGNDFLFDLGKKKGEAPFSLTPYLKDLPVVTVKGKKYYFVNGIGYGIDGYCCEIGDKIRATSDKPINYTSIAIKGLLYDYHPTNATVTVDGVTKTYKKVWLAPTMNGRCYGGGMLATPAQDRLNKERTVSSAVMFGSGKLKTLMVFPSIFKGEHVKHTEMVDINVGHEIEVKFDRPVALQIDGETILDVTEYKVTAGVGLKLDEKQEMTV